MKKNLIYKVVVVLTSTIFITGSCTNEEEEFNCEQEIKITASFEGKETKVSLEQADDLSLISKWENDDIFDVFVNMERVGTNVPVFDISSDRKSCSFIVAPSRVYTSDESHLFCATSPAKAMIANGKMYCNASLNRSPLSKYNAPVFASAEIDYWGQVAIVFRHYLVYEVAHIRNESNSSISFSLCGYESNDGLWYIPRAYFDIEYGAVIVDPNATWDPVPKSEAIVINPGEYGVIVSTYLTNGKKISKATMLAEIDGRQVSSYNTLSSDVELHIAHAYHLYATWDGTVLSFAKGSGVDAGGSGYGSGDSGDLSGTGLGYMVDESGNIVGGGSGYGADESGDISGSGSGYSNGN